MRSSGMYRPRRTFRIHAMTIPTVLLLCGAAGIGYHADGSALGRMSAAITSSGCDIKGNVSIDTGERIYHMPGQKFYDDTKISTEWGERWFCSEDDARKAGWRKSKR